jgi:hypothetical protein
MREWLIQNDQILDKGIETPRIGKYKKANNSVFSDIPRDQHFIFPFCSTSHSLGDWGIISRLPECIKKIYPNVKVYIPSSSLIYDIFRPLFLSGQWSSFIKKPWEVGDMILKNNPYIDGVFNKNELQGECFTDHYRLYSSEDNDNEPLVEQMLRAFGLSDEEISQIDSRPKIYLSQEEEEWYKNFISKHFGEEYGCLLLASSIDKFNKQWEFNSSLFPHIKKFKDYPVFYYSSFELGNDWLDKFSNFTSFSKLNLTFRQQLIIKQKAIFNTGYQAGITDSISGGGSEIVTLTPYDNIGKNIIRGVKYVFKKGDTKTL